MGSLARTQPGLPLALALALVAAGAGCEVARSEPDASAETTQPDTDQPDTDQPDTEESDSEDTGEPAHEDGLGLYPDVPHIIAVGDLHGDLASTGDVLIGAGIIDKDGHWIAGETWVVQVGDQLDRGYYEEEILALFELLRVEAFEAGGRFLVLNGNHEILQAEGHFDYVIDDEAFGGLEARALAFAPGGEWARVLAQRNVIIKVGRTLFVHGGVSPDQASLGIEFMNEQTRAWLAGELATEPAFVDGSGSLVWDRTYSEDEPGQLVAERCELLGEVLAIFDADRIVVGHTVHDQITSICDDRAWRIDTGMSAYYGGILEVLELTGDVVSVITVP